jgi:hypothetical protein
VFYNTHYNKIVYYLSYCYTQSAILCTIVNQYSNIFNVLFVTRNGQNYLLYKKNKKKYLLFNIHLFSFDLNKHKNTMENKEKSIYTLKSIARWMEKSSIEYTEETLKIALNDVLTYYSLYLKENEYYCEMCSREISKGDHNFSDICGNCLENEVDL